MKELGIKALRRWLLWDISLPSALSTGFLNTVVFLASTPHLSDLLACCAVCRVSLDSISLPWPNLGRRTCDLLIPQRIGSPASSSVGRCWEDQKPPMLSVPKLCGPKLQNPQAYNLRSNPTNTHTTAQSSQNPSSSTPSTPSMHQEDSHILAFPTLLCHSGDTDTGSALGAGQRHPRGPHHHSPPLVWFKMQAAGSQMQILGWLILCVTLAGPNSILDVSVRVFLDKIII